MFYFSCCKIYKIISRTDHKEQSWFITRTFSGDVGAVDWGIKGAGVTNDFESNGKILSLKKMRRKRF